MANNKVIQSIEAPGGQLCLDLFCHPDGSFGFEEYRRDPEDGRGWYSTGHRGFERFASAEEALAAAERIAPWIVDCMP